MTNNQRRMLTKYLGECWHTKSTWKDANRTFDDPDDLHALVCKMKGDDWENFIWDAMRDGEDVGGFVFRLITDPEKACQLIAEWMEQEAK